MVDRARKAFGESSNEVSEEDQATHTNCSPSNRAFVKFVSYLSNGAPGATRIPSATPGLGRRMQAKTHVIEVHVIAETAFCCQAFALSNQFPFVY
jgi:hypothetical protein